MAALVRRSLFFSAIVLTFGIVPTVPQAAAQHRILPLDHWAYEYLQRMQRRGHLLELNPTALPYTMGDVRRALDRLDPAGLGAREAEWARLLREEFTAASAEGEEILAGGEFQPGLRAGSSNRLDPLRPTDEGSATLQVGSARFYPHAAARLHAEFGPAVAQIGVRHDVYYRDDPDGLLAANRLIARNEDAYAGIGTRYVSAYVGRIPRHWAPYDDDGVLVTRNPVGISQIGLRIGGERLGLTSMVGELDSITPDGRYTGAAGADSVGGSMRRYVSAHRFDWRPTRRFGLTVMGAAVFAGPNSGFSLNFLNPLALPAFAVDGRPKNDENKGLVAGILWFQLQRWTVHGQLLIDDVDLMGETGEPMSAALAGSLIYAGFPSADVGGRIAVVTARTYNTHFPQTVYIHLRRGIATQFSDFVQLSAFSSIYLGSGNRDVVLSPRVDLLFQGEFDIRLPFPANDEVGLILDGVVERTIRPGVEMRIQSRRAWWVHADVGINFVANDAHVRDRNRTLLTATASIGTRFGFSERLRPFF